jgi:hypothetical protein
MKINGYWWIVILFPCFSSQIINLMSNNNTETAFKSYEFYIKYDVKKKKF